MKKYIFWFLCYDGKYIRKKKEIKNSKYNVNKSEDGSSLAKVFFFFFFEFNVILCIKDPENNKNGEYNNAKSYMFSLVYG